MYNILTPSRSVNHSGRTLTILPGSELLIHRLSLTMSYPVLANNPWLTVALHLPGISSSSHVTLINLQLPFFMVHRIHGNGFSLTRTKVSSVLVYLMSTSLFILATQLQYLWKRSEQGVNPARHRHHWEHPYKIYFSRTSRTSRVPPPPIVSGAIIKCTDPLILNAPRLMRNNMSPISNSLRIDWYPISHT